MHQVNQVISVNAFYFEDDFRKDFKTDKQAAQHQLKAYPRQIEFGSTQYTFSDGLQCLIRKGQRVVRLFDMTDGRTRFRLKQEDDQWTLVGTRSMQVGA